MVAELDYTVVYDMIRGGQCVAQVVTFSSGKCVVSWPTSTIVYDNEADARAVHVEHMGGRGEVTTFVPVWSDGPEFFRGYTDAQQDHIEGCWFASVTQNYEWERPGPASYAEDPDSYYRGYAAAALVTYGPNWEMEAAQRAAEQRAARIARKNESRS